MHLRILEHLRRAFRAFHSTIIGGIRRIVSTLYRVHQIDMKDRPTTYNFRDKILYQTPVTDD